MHTLQDTLKDLNETILIQVKELEKQGDEITDLRYQLMHAWQLVDDLLYDPGFEPVDENGERIRGDDYYLLDHGIQNHHLPAIRKWFVQIPKKYPWLEENL